MDLFIVEKLPPSELRPMSVKELTYWHELFLFGIESQKREKKRAKELAANRKKLGIK